MGLRLNPQFRWFVRQVRPFLRAHVLSVSMMVLSSLMFLLDPLLIKWLIDRVLPSEIAAHGTALEGLPCQRIRVKIEGLQDGT